MTDTEKAALERRIDELCAEVEKYRSARDASVDLATKTIDRVRELEAEVERLHADQAHWELGNCPSCPNIAYLQEALEQNTKLRELLEDMKNAPCCGNYCWMEIPQRLRDVGIEVPE